MERNFKIKFLSTYCGPQNFYFTARTSLKVLRSVKHIMTGICTILVRTKNNENGENS